MAKNKLLTGMITGALVGTAISLLDKKTRVSTIQSLSECKTKVSKVVKDPEQTIKTFNEGISTLNGKLQTMTEDVVFVLDKVQQITKTTTKNVTRLDDRGNNS